MFSGFEAAGIGMVIGAVVALIGSFITWMWLRRRRRDAVPADVIPSAEEPAMRGAIWEAWMEEHWRAKDPQRRS